MKNETKLGNIIDGPADRDAVHVAVVPVISAHTLHPGQHVGRIDGDRFGASEAPVGIVDPFLRSAVLQGQQFYLCLYPGSITSLRHDWAHPSFEAVLAGELSASTEKQASEKWIRDFADEYDISYTKIMNHAARAAENEIEFEDYIVGGSELEGETVPEEFWRHYEIVTGKTASVRANFFTCSC